jgi:hypothetical protein
MKTMMVTLLCLCAASAAPARQASDRPGADETRAALVAAAGDDALQDDPAYARYKEGYNAILEEQWSKAVQKLAAVIDAYPKSEYRDDAEYWHAYALKHIDRKHAIEAYKKFVRDFQKSSYYDDAVADLEQLDSGITVVSSPGGETQVFVGGDGYAYGFSTDSVEAADAATPAPPAPAAAAAPPARLTTRELNRLNRELQRAGRAVVTLPRIAPLPRMHPTPFAVTTPGSTYTYGGWSSTDDKVDPETQLKLDALYALGDGKEDEKSFATLKGVALDTRQSLKLRSAALDMVSSYKKFDVLSIYTEIAKRDTSEAMQSYAVDYISNSTTDKNKSVQTLIDLFNGAPKSRAEQKRRIFFAIAEVGNDRAVDFLSNVARTSDNYDLRREAVFYLGTMGSDKARSALYDILGGAKEH